MDYWDLYYYGYGAANGVMVAVGIISLAIGIVAIIANWKIFEKAGEPGWAAIVPFYNLYILYKITWGNGWFFLLLLIPGANAVIMIVTMVKLSTAFGKGGGFACGLIFLSAIFLMILAFSKEIQYVGVGGVASAGPGGYNNGGYQNPYQGGYQNQNQYQNPYQGQNQYQNPYQNQAGYQPPPSQQYQQSSPQNPEYRYQRNEPQTPPTGSFCPSCGAKLDPGTKFCGSCGAQI